jgi:hypothetical protein
MEVERPSKNMELKMRCHWEPLREHIGNRKTSPSPCPPNQKIYIFNNIFKKNSSQKFFL